MLGRVVYRRLLPLFRKAWTRDLDTRVKDLQHQLQAVQDQLADLRQAHRSLALNHWHATRVERADTLDSLLDAAAIRAHVQRVVDEARLCHEPTTYLTIEGVFPADFYRLLLDAVPPMELFSDRDPVKRDFEMDELDRGPELTARVWRFFDEVVVRDILAPALFERCREAVVDHYAETGGREFGVRATAIPHRTAAGRIQLRRPGYHLGPHLDPKRVAITGLLYLARDRAGAAYGTQLFRIDQPFVASGMKTFFPEQAGLRCELAQSLPFLPNTLVAFVNSRAAHGATLPLDATLQERYSYQFYVKPDDGMLKTLLNDVPPDARNAWEGLL